MAANSTLSPSATQQLAAIAASASALATQQAALASASAAISGNLSSPAYYKIIGIILALVSGLFIGSSFVFKKKGLLISQQKVLDQGGQAGESHAYLKSPMWWAGMSLMIVGEICNFVAYAFADAILVTPMGALSVVVSAVLSSIFLKERLSFFGKVGCFLCVLGAVIIAVNGPKDQAVSTIPEFERLFLAPGFLVFASVIVISAVLLIFVAAPRWGKSNMLVYIAICSIIGGLSVVSTQGLGASIVTTFRGESQFKYWFIYFLIGFVVCTLLTEINYLNKALELFNTAMVTPTYYVMFTFATLVTSIILFQGLKAPAADIITLVLGFLVICCGITLLQMSKVDPLELTGLDPKSTVFLAADKEIDAEPGLAAEEPGVDGLRGFGGLVGSIHRNSLIARHSTASSLAAASERSSARQRRHESYIRNLGQRNPEIGMIGLKRHNLWDRPVPDETVDDPSRAVSSQGTVTSDHQRKTTKPSSYSLHNVDESQARNDRSNPPPFTHLSSINSKTSAEASLGYQSTTAMSGIHFETNVIRPSGGYKDPYDDPQPDMESRLSQPSRKSTQTSDVFIPGNPQRLSTLRDHPSLLTEPSSSSTLTSIIPSASPSVRARQPAGDPQGPKNLSKMMTTTTPSQGLSSGNTTGNLYERTHHRPTRDRAQLGSKNKRLEYEDRTELESLVRTHSPNRSSSISSSISCSSDLSDGLNLVVRQK